MMRIIKVSILLTLISCSTSHAVTKTHYIPVHQLSRISSVKVIAPANYKKIKPETQSFIAPNYEIDLYARNFVRGDLIYLEIVNLEQVNRISINVNNKNIILSKRKWGYRGFFTIHPLNENPKVNLKVTYDLDREKKLEDVYSFMLEKKDFPVSRSALNLGKYSQPDITAQKEVQEQIERDIKFKTKVFANIDPDHFNNILAHPRDNNSTSSGFYAKRIYEQYKYVNGKKVMLEPKVSYHRGFDFRAKKGDPVYAMASGKVVLAHELYFEGNCIMIDHGDKVISVYMHLSKFNTYEGQYIKAGHLIGRVGSTGISTGPHLHVSLFVDSIPTDPMSLLPLPIRN